MRACVAKNDELCKFPFRIYFKCAPQKNIHLISSECGYYVCSDGGQIELENLNVMVWKLSKNLMEMRMRVWKHSGEKQSEGFFYVELKAPS